MRFRFQRSHRSKSTITVEAAQGMNTFTETKTTIIVRANLPMHLSRALDQLAIDVGKSKSALLTEAAGSLLAFHERTVNVTMPGGGR